MDFPHILLSVPKLWPSKRNREGTVLLPPSPQSSSKALCCARAILDSFWHTQALPHESADVGSRQWGRGWQRPPSLLGWPPQEDSTSHNLPYQVWEQLPAYPCRGVTRHYTSAPSGDSTKIPPTMGACEFPLGFRGVQNNILLQKVQSNQPLWEDAPIRVLVPVAPAALPSLLPTSVSPWY